MKYFLITFSIYILTTTTSISETRIESLIGVVTKVDVLKSSYVKKIPQDERICQIKEIPIYNQKQDSSELGNMIVGGLIGSAIGNKLTEKDGGGTFGAVTGAILGREQAKKTAQSGDIVGYKQQEVCKTQRTIREEIIENITGYRFQIEADDKILTLEKSTPLTVGDRIELSKRISYSIK